MSELPCICCENGDPAKHVICRSCDDLLDKRTETFELMVHLVQEMNNLGDFPSKETKDELHEKVLTIYDLLCEIKIEKPA